MLSIALRRSVCAVTLLALFAMPAAALTVIDKPIYFTFSAPVMLPGVTLGAGTYLFRLGNPFSSRNVVHVFDESGMKHYATFLVNPAVSAHAPEKPEIRFYEGPPTAPYAIRAWWYPNDSLGFEPVYPREQAMRIAQGTGEPVLTSRATATALIEAKDVTRVAKDGKDLN